MKIVTQTDRVGLRLGDEKAVEMICAAGFDAIDYSMFQMNRQPNHILMSDEMSSYVLNLKKIANEKGVFFSQSHAPFPSMRKGDDDYNKFAFSCIVRAIEVSSLLGVETMVVHPVHFKEGTDFEANLKFYNALVPYIEKYGVKVATENMWGSKNGKYYPMANGTAQDFRRMMDMLDSRYFVACLDIGHCGMVGQNPADMIRAIGGKHLHALHVHDNNNLSDAHFFPFNGTVDWNETTKALAEINYDGNLTFEADNSMITCPEFFLPTALNYLHEIGKALVKMIENNRK